VQAGRPASWSLQQIKSACRLKYRSAIRDAYCLFERAHDTEISQHWLRKKPTEFWKAWHSKFSKKINTNVILPGCNSNKDIADQFASHFESVYYRSNDDIAAIDTFLCESQKYISDSNKITRVSSRNYELVITGNYGS